MTPSAITEGFDILAWDSELFGFPVAAIHGDAIQAGRWPQVQAALRAGRVRLAYALAANANTAARDLLRTSGARQVDLKRRYRKLVDQESQLSGSLQPVLGQPCSAEFESLALASGEYSRFRADPDIPPGVFESLYKTWIRRSLSGEIADSVLALFHGSSLAGMITVAVSGDSGMIGLVAVAAGCRGRGFGRQLVQGAEAWCAARSVHTLEVVTQGQNAAGCALYAASGFACVREEAVFHLWLPSEGE
jgi:dTDP-4-amino-4,6-dideoxy-D-galactose acyltransferase